MFYLDMITVMRVCNAVIVYTIVILCGYKTYVKTKRSAQSQQTKHLQQMLTIMMVLQVKKKKFLYKSIRLLRLAASAI